MSKAKTETTQDETSEPTPEVQEHNDNVLEDAKEAAGEDREPGDFVGISPAAFDKVGAKAVDLDRQSAYLPQEDEDLSAGVEGARTPYVEED